MSNLYAMRRANGDWFALEEQDRRLVPVFHSSHDAFMARLRSVEMQLFSPIALDATLLKEIAECPSEVDFFMVENPFTSLKQGNPILHAEVLSLMASDAPSRRWKWLARPWSS